jgi:hypothetical protein
MSMGSVHVSVFLKATTWEEREESQQVQVSPQRRGERGEGKSLIWGLRPSANWSGCLIRCHRSSPHACDDSSLSPTILTPCTKDIPLSYGEGSRFCKCFVPEGVESVSSNAQKKSTRYDFMRLWGTTYRDSTTQCMTQARTTFSGKDKLELIRKLKVIHTDENK